jgi:hypothetical protein
MDNWIYIGVVEEDGQRHIQKAFRDEKSALEWMEGIKSFYEKSLGISDFSTGVETQNDLHEYNMNWWAYSENSPYGVFVFRYRNDLPKDHGCRIYATMSNVDWDEQPQKIYATEDEAREWIRQEFLKAKAEDPSSDNESFIWADGKDSDGLRWWSCGHAEKTLDWTVYELNLEGGGQ